MLFEDIVSLNGPHTKSMLKVLFEERGIRIRKQWGQNFLIDQNLLQFIVKTAELSRNDVVLEIGAGTGSVTRLIAEKAGHVFGVELDRKLFKILEETLKDFNNVTLINKDILKSKHHIHPEIVEAISDYIHTANSSTGDLCVKVIANLPYYISTPVIIDLLQEVLPIKTMVLTLQRDTTNRMVAHPGTKSYGVLSIMTRLFADVKVLKKLSPYVFWPVPLVDSAIVRIIYSSRRKTLLNSLLSLCSGLGIKNDDKETRKYLVVILERAGIRPESRGEELDLEKLIDLSNEISDYVNSQKDFV